MKIVKNQQKFFEILTVLLVFGQLNGDATLCNIPALSSPIGSPRTIRTKAAI